jgi:hypothetical protein
LSTATQNVSLEQETPEMVVLPSMLTALLHVDPLSAEVKTFPSPLTAAHNEVDEQDTPYRLLALMLVGALQAAAPPVGLVERSTFPFPSTATQNEVEGHEIPWR